MIDKSKAQQKGYQVLDGDTQPYDEKAERMKQLKATLPGIVNGDGKVDIKVLEGLLGQEKITPDGQGYGLNFAGKGLARVISDEPTDRGLKVELDQSKDFDTTGNVIIRGDNLDVLKILRANYYKAVKMIYIDPPYNTDSDNFIYKDSFKVTEADLIERFNLNEDEIDFFDNMLGTLTHSGWLYAMYPRLKLARELLTDDGFIFISIDDREQANLKILCDEIFGQECFKYCLSVVNNLNGNDNRAGMIETQEYCLIYSKKGTESDFGVLDVLEERHLWHEDDMGFWKQGRNLLATGENAPRAKRPNLFFPVYIDEKNLAFSLEKDENHSFELWPRSKGKDMSWSWEKESFVTDRDEVIVKRTKDGKISLHKKQRPALGDLPSKRGKVTFYKPEYSNTSGNRDIVRLFDERVFSYPKSVNLIKDFISLGMPDKETLILDFFAGSGTTAHAVMDLNKVDEGNRKFILVQQDEEINEQSKSVAYQFCIDNELTPVISSICIERVNRAGDDLKDMLSNELDVGYKVFSLADRPKLKEENGQFKLEDPRATTNDKLYNMLAASGKPLHIAIEEVEPDLLYKADEAYYVLGECEADLKDQPQVFIDGYAEISLEKWLNTLGLDKSNVTILY